MTTQLDSFIGIGAESGYGQTAARTDFLDYTEDNLDYTLTATDGQGLRPGRRTTLPQQRRITKIEAGGDFTVEASAAQVGVLLAAFMGAGTSAHPTGATKAYEHLFTPSADYLPSYTIQKGVPTLGGGPAVPITFVGMQCSQLELDVNNGDIPTIKTTWVGKNIDATVESPDSPVYPAVDELFDFTEGSIVVGGTPTPPSGTAFGSGGTAVATVQDATITLDNALDSDGFNLGGGGARTRPAASLLQKLTGKVTAEFSDTVFWDQYTGQERLALVLNFKGSLIEGSLYNQLQVYVPVMILEGDTPKTKAGSIVTQSIDFTIFHDLENGLAPIYFALQNQVSDY